MRVIRDHNNSGTGMTVLSLVGPAGTGKSTTLARALVRVAEVCDGSAVYLCPNNDLVDDISNTISKGKQALAKRRNYSRSKDDNVRRSHVVDAIAAKMAGRKSKTRHIVGTYSQGKSSVKMAEDAGHVLVIAADELHNCDPLQWAFLANAIEEAGGHVVFVAVGDLIQSTMTHSNESLWACLHGREMPSLFFQVLYFEAHNQKKKKTK